MKEQGIVIFPDGEILTFGKQVYTDQPNYLSSPGHEKSFIDEIEPSFEFKLSGLKYDFNKNLYQNAIDLSLAGLVFILNNTLNTTSKQESLCYVPELPSQEQLSILRENDYDSIFEINNIYQFNSNDFDDYQEYNSFYDYINAKEKRK
ncbi:MAG: hypothetical protein PUB18_01845 [bacterium]|nr:hypothetical protein [bacterium]